MKDDSDPLGAKCNTSGIWKIATLLPSIAAGQTDTPCSYYWTKSTLFKDLVRMRRRTRSVTLNW